MKKSAKYLTLILIIGIIFSINGCDEVTQPFKEAGNVTPGDTDSVLQNVLLEDFTGHECPNCPEAQVIAKSLSDLYPGRVVVLSIHASDFYAAPNAEHPYDFRTTTGTTLDNFFKISPDGLPAGMINRIDDNNSKRIGRFSWESLVATELQKTPKVSLKLTASYDDSKKQITASL